MPIKRLIAKVINKSKALGMLISNIKNETVIVSIFWKVKIKNIRAIIKTRIILTEMISPVCFIYKLVKKYLDLFPDPGDYWET